MTPLDPQLFSRITDFAGELSKASAAGSTRPSKWRNGWRTWPPPPRRGSDVDVQIQAGLGRFFAAKFRAGVLYHLHEQTGDRAALEAAIKAVSRRARSLVGNRESRQGRVCRGHHGRRAALAPRALARPAARNRRGHRRYGKAAGRRKGQRPSTPARRHRGGARPSASRSRCRCATRRPRGSRPGSRWH